MSSVVLVFVLDWTMSPARSRCSASHAMRTHGWLPQKTWWPGLRRGGIDGYNLQSPPTVADQPRACCIRLVPFLGIDISVVLELSVWCSRLWSFVCCILAHCNAVSFVISSLFVL